MVLQEIKRIVPSEINEFHKLNGGDDPYKFVKWGSDEYFYYSFKSRDGKKTRIKRLFLSEFESLLEHAGTGLAFITRTDFNSICVHTKRDGDCGFCVMIRLIGHLGLGVYRRRKGVEITNMELLRKLLGIPNN